MEWTEYLSGEPGAYTPMERWGRDHWSTFAYLETCVVDNRGLIDNRRMRCNARLHLAFANGMNATEYPTILKEGQLAKHDDWSCLEDMVAANLIRAWHYRPAGEPCKGQAKVELTETGRQIATQLREHKARGGKWSTFESPVCP